MWGPVDDMATTRARLKSTVVSITVAVAMNITVAGAMSIVMAVAVAVEHTAGRPHHALSVGDEGASIPLKKNLSFGGAVVEGVFTHCILCSGRGVAGAPAVAIWMRHMCVLAAVML